MNRILMTTAAALLFAAPVAAQVGGPTGTGVSPAPAEPETAIGVMERRQLLSDPAVTQPSGVLIDADNRYTVDCADPNVTCTNMDTTGSIGMDAEPAMPDTAIGIEQRRDDEPQINR